MSLARGASRVGSVDLGTLRSFLGDALTVVDVEVRKVRHDPVELMTRAIQPILWLVIFGQVVAKSRLIPTGNLSYLDFFAPGVLAQSALFSAIFYGIAVIWERDLGVVHMYLASPASRLAIVTGKGLAGGVRALTQAVVVYVVAWASGVHLRLDPVSIAAVAAIVVIGSSAFATFSLAIACLVRSRERFMGIGQVITMPLFFASSAIYPIASMPGWLQVVATFNPLTYQVDALRTLMVQGAQSVHGVGVDLVVLAVTATVLIGVSSRLYPRLAQ